MALSNEDKKDVKNAMGKAMANKVARVTRDKKTSDDYFGLPHGEKNTRQLRDRFKNYVKRNEKSFGPGDRYDDYRLQRHNSFYQFNKPEYDSPKKSAKSQALKNKKK